MRRHPIFVFDSKERFFPLAVESILGWTNIVKPTGEIEKLKSLDQLPRDGGQIDFPPNPEFQQPTLELQFGNVGYLRRVGRRGGLVWLSYWFWYTHNPKKWVGYGVHEGDWEFVQVGYCGEQPIVVTASQHHGGEARYWWHNIELRDRRPVIYVARDSHANLFKVGVTVEDVCDGEGRVLDAVEWREFGDWVDWPGRWGHSLGAGKSPDSPARQGDRWHAPHLFHAKARCS